MNRFVSQLTVAIAASVALAAVACSSAPPDIASGNDNTKTKTPAASSTKAGSNDPTTPPANPTTPQPSTPLSDNSECGMKPDAMTCGTCCEAKTPGAMDASDKIYGDCICAAATCLTVCAASACADADNTNTPTAACQTCLDTNNDSCGAKADASCAADAKCTAEEACLTTQCDPKEPKTP